MPCGRPSTMSTRTTSARPASAMRWAVVAPTLPAPMTVTLLRAMTDQPSALVSASIAAGPALRTASDTPSAYLAKLSWNIPAILRAAAS